MSDRSSQPDPRHDLPWSTSPVRPMGRSARRAVRVRRLARGIGRRSTMIGLIGVVLGLIFVQTSRWALGGGDVQKLTSFVEQVETEWFSGAHDFRELNLAYARSASEAATIQPFNQPLVDAMRAIRSHRFVTTFFPEFTWDQGSADHYETFVRGPLHSYFLRNEEVAGDWYIQERRMITQPLRENGWAAEPPRYEDLREIFPETMQQRPGFAHFIDGQLQQLYADLRPPAHLASAESAADLAATDYAQVNRQLRREAQQLSFELGYGSDLDRLSIDEQSEVLAKLDAHVRESDTALWQRKQLSDFTLGLIGIPEATNAYVNLCAKPFIAVHSTFRTAGILLTVIFSMVLAARLLDQCSRTLPQLRFR